MLAVHLGRHVGADDETLRDTYWGALLRFLGCTAFSHEESGFGAGDDYTVKRAMASVEFAPKATGLGHIITTVGSTGAIGPRVRGVAKLLTDPGAPTRHAEAACDAGLQLGERLGMDPGVLRVLDEAFEHWDGHGHPSGRTGESLAQATRLIQVADAAERGFRVGGSSGAIGTVRSRAGKALDPDLAGAFLDASAEMICELEPVSVWETLLDSEPGEPLRVHPARVDLVAEAFARFADLKSVWTLGHSVDVAALAAAAAVEDGLDAADVQLVRRAALLHDIGRTAVSNRVWDKPARLDRAELELVKLHAYQTERILSVAPALEDVVRVAGGTHERQDGSGYPKSLRAGRHERFSTLVAAADVLVALVSDRPHRAAVSTAEAADTMAAEVRDGRLERAATEAVLAASDLGLARRLPNPGELSDREVDVLRLVARGATNKDVGRDLGITAKTVAHHVAHVYDKLGVRSRAGAALYAADHGLV